MGIWSSKFWARTVELNAATAATIEKRILQGELGSDWSERECCYRETVRCAHEGNNQFLKLPRTCRNAVWAEAGASGLAGLNPLSIVYWRVG